MADNLVKEGLLTKDQLAVARESQKNRRRPLAEILIQRGYITEKDLLHRLGHQRGMAVITLESYRPDPAVLKKLSPVQAHHWRILPLFEVEGKLTVATEDPFNLSSLDDARTELGCEMDVVMSSRSDLDQALKKYYGTPPHELRKSNKTVEVIASEGDEPEDSKAPLLQMERETEVVSAVDHLLLMAVQERASDLHLEPTRNELKARLRIDGILEDTTPFPKAMHHAMISRIKILGRMDVAERRLPQDGRIRIKIASQEIDLRIASYPTMFGEAVAIRFLSKDHLLTLQDLGFLQQDKQVFEQIIQKPHGIFLVAGPTGSGKTTTLYAALLQIDRHSKHVLSIEDPIENEIDGIAQTQVNVKAGLTFATSIRSMLREDPDIIMVGEIRDQETADITLRAAMTGHLVFSTLHTNTAVGAVARLIDLGVEPYLISSTLLGVLAQRLARRICDGCKRPDSLSSIERTALGPLAEGLSTQRGTGCKLCRMTGYRGRIGLFELVQLNDEMRVLINNRAPEVRLREKAGTLGSHTIIDDGLEKVRQGFTTVEEVLRVAAEV